MDYEKNGGVHSKETLQYSKKAKTTVEKYAEHCNLSYDKCSSDKVEDISVRGKVMLLKK